MKLSAKVELTTFTHTDSCYERWRRPVRAASPDNEVVWLWTKWHEFNGIYGAKDDIALLQDTCLPKHRHQEWIRFLNLIRRHTPADKEIHIICDNYATHKHAKVHA